MSRLTGWLASAATLVESVGMGTAVRPRGVAKSSAEATAKATAEATVALAASSGAWANDWALWRDACAGDARSAATLVRALSPQAYGLAIHMLGKREDAQDAVQDAFLRLWRSHPSDGHGARLATYFNTIVINCCRSQRSAGSAQRREQATEDDALCALHDAQQLQGDAPAPFVALDARNEATRLQAALVTLPSRQRMAITMWAYADASAADIARSLDIDPNAAHQLLHRAKQALRAQLEESPP